MNWILSKLFPLRPNIYAYSRTRAWIGGMRSCN